MTTHGEPPPEGTVSSDEALDVGDKLPDVEALVCDGETFRPRKLRDSVTDRGLVLVFHGFAFSAIATNWMERYSRYGWKDFDGVSLAGVVRDGPYSVNAFLRDIEGDVEIYADVDAEITDAFGLRRRRSGMPGASSANRSAYVFDGDGVATYRWLAEDDVSPVDVDAVEAAVEEL